MRAIRNAASFKEALAVFAGLQRLRLEDSVDVFNALLRVAAAARQWEDGLHVFRHLTEVGVWANTETYNALLRACVNGAPDGLGHCLHGRLGQCLL